MTDGIFSCGVTPIGVGPRLFTQVDTMNARVDQTLSTTLALADELASYQIANVSFSVDPTDVQTYEIRDLDDPDEFDEVFFDDSGIVIPADLGPANTPTIPGPGAAPAPPSDAPSPQIPVAVTLYHPSFGVTPTPVFPVAPTYGDLTGGIPFPDLRDIVLPPPPVVDFGIPFTGVRPVFDAVAPDAADFDYTEQAYSPLLVNEIKTAIQAMLAGTTGLPRVVEDALWARQAEREAGLAAAATQDAFDEMATRGFTLPNGPLQSKLMQIRQNNQNQTNSLGRDVMIRIHETIVKQLEIGVTQGIALEDVWVKLYSDVQERRLKAAQVAVTIAISVYNALVAQYQAAGAVYRVEADVYATLIQAELAKLQAYSEELKGLQLIGELNKQDVDVYTARLGAVETNVRVYLAEIQSYTALTDAEKLKLDAFRVSIEIEDEKLKASAQELEAWKGQIQGQELIQQAFATRTQSYLGAIQAWKTTYEAQLDFQKGQIAKLESDNARYVAQFQGVTAKVNFQTAKGQALVSNNATKIQKYTAGATFTGAYNQALEAKIKMINDSNAQNTTLALKNGEINAQNGLAVQQTLERAIEVATQVLAQMTSSFASSVNLTGSASDSTSFSQACSYQTSQTLDH